MGKKASKFEKNQEFLINPFPENHNMVSSAQLYCYKMKFLGRIQFQEHLCTKKMGGGRIDSQSGFCECHSQFCECHSQITFFFLCD